MDSKNRQTTKNKTLFQSFSHAWDGLKWIFANERNFRFHILAACVVILFGILLKVSLAEWMWLVLAIFGVLAAETINTLVERLVDFINGTKYDAEVKVIKDVSAGGTLLTAVFAAIIGLCIFVPRLLKLI